MSCTFKDRNFQLQNREHVINDTRSEPRTVKSSSVRNCPTDHCLVPSKIGLNWIGSYRGCSGFEDEMRLDGFDCVHVTCAMWMICAWGHEVQGPSPKDGECICTYVRSYVISTQVAMWPIMTHAILCGFCGCRVLKNLTQSTVKKNTRSYLVFRIDVSKLSGCDVTSNYASDSMWEIM